MLLTWDWARSKPVVAARAHVSAACHRLTASIITTVCPAIGGTSQASRPSAKDGHLDGTGEALAGLLRAGNAGSATATDHVTVLDDARAQLPIDPAEGAEVIVRADSAGWSHKFVPHCRARRTNIVIGHRLTVDTANVLVNVPKRTWSPGHLSRRLGLA